MRLKQSSKLALKADKKVDYSTGIDAMRFIIPKTTFLKFFKKLELSTNLRAISRNKTLASYANQKFKGDVPLIMPKGCEYKVRFVSFKRGVSSLTNAMIVVENSNDLNDLCKKRKKPFGYFVKVVFAGLYQPSREVYKKTYQILSKFARRFKCDSFDIASDFDTQESKTAGAKSKAWFRRIVAPFNASVISYKTTLYANHCQRERFYNLTKICFYDKFEKQTNYHNERIDNEHKNWHRVELTYKLKAKFSQVCEFENMMQYVYVMDEITNKLSDGCYPFGVDYRVLQTQTAFFKDNRRALSFTKSA